MTEEPKFTGHLTSATIGGQPIDLKAIAELMLKVDNLRESQIFGWLWNPKPIEIPMMFEPPKDDPGFIRFRSFYDFRPMIQDRRMLITSVADGPCWCPPDPPNRFIEYDASDRAWMEPLGMGEWR